MDYTRIYRPKQHYITIPQIPERKLFMNNRQLNRIVSRQHKDWDLYITKYPKDHCISNIILDYDDKDNPDNALSDVELLKRYLHRKGLNTVIVQSGRKGYHAYIQIPCHNFIGGELAHAEAEPNTWFKQYIKNLIGLYDGKCYPTLDEINFSSGLNGNIRIIGSIHPRSGNPCEIIEGEFISDVEPNKWDWKCFNISKSHAEDKVTIFKKSNHIVEGADLIADNDLQDIFEELYGVEVKRYNGYSYCQCPFHSDKKPSCFVDKEKFICKSCGAKGNIYTLIKRGDLKINNDVRISKR